MRYINLEALANTPEIQAFEELAEQYMQQMQGMTTVQKKEFIRTHTNWNALQQVMFNLSYGKCWYSEAPIGAGEFVIDHYRPKNRSKQFKTESIENPNEEQINFAARFNGQVIKTNGYWWLAYNWRNFRLVGSLVNLRRTDRFSENEEVMGKGDYFPLDLLGGAECQEPPNDNINVEVPFLLDPSYLYDTTLISFDKDGTPLISGNAPEEDKFRALVSIELFHIGLEQLNLERIKIWRLCERELREFNEQLSQPVNPQAKRLLLNRAAIRLRELTAQDAPYSKVAWSCIYSFERQNVFNKWLPNLIPSLAS